MRKALIIMEPGFMRDSLQEELRQDFEVLVFSRTEDVALRTRLDVVVLDLFLPGMDGLSFLEKNKPYLPPVVVVLSVLTTPEILDALAALGVTAVIRKPCTVKAILSAMKICV